MKNFSRYSFQNFNFDWLVTPGMSIYTIVIAAVWQSSGFIMAIFLAGLRSIDDEIIKAAKIDGAGIVSIYTKIILPMMRPVFMSAIVILVHLAIKSYDLVIALTAGGPGISSDMPAVFMTQMAFHRSEIGLASASAIMMFLTVTAIVVPYLYSELKRKMTEDSYKILEQKSGKNKIIFRWILFIILGIFALYYITPLYVMIVTSFKTMDEIRQGNIFYLPDTLYFEPWLEAWRGQLVNTTSGLAVDAGNVYLKTYFGIQ